MRARIRPTITDALFRLKPKSTVCLWEHALRKVAVGGQVDLDRGRPPMTFRRARRTRPKRKASSISCSGPTAPAPPQCSIKPKPAVASACGASRTKSMSRQSRRCLAAADIPARPAAQLRAAGTSGTRSLRKSPNSSSIDAETAGMTPCLLAWNSRDRQAGRLDEPRCGRRGFAVGRRAKVGHAGTLDPAATGVLPVAVDDGTVCWSF